ncbi:hypothetical protein AXG93_4577s1100 [Marchantia polymorpha subsp. ruderalis]|uniref:Uncharacterized protein n=1 Tax=Marchantia polymorpha subsp. ruderalis TaxID=1480154 RepID=A0A176W4X7_MARPO|nr:hypothetical protein AXG93_4577s1100 [Marchantia polymorpha subsp. ruderalis]
MAVMEPIHTQEARGPSAAAIGGVTSGHVVMAAQSRVGKLREEQGSSGARPSLRSMAVKRGGGSAVGVVSGQAGKEYVEGNLGDTRRCQSLPGSCLPHGLISDSAITSSAARGCQGSDSTDCSTNQYAPGSPQFVRAQHPDSGKRGLAERPHDRDWHQLVPFPQPQPRPPTPTPTPPARAGGLGASGGQHGAHGRTRSETGLGLRLGVRIGVASGER